MATTEQRGDPLYRGVDVLLLGLAGLLVVIGYPEFAVVPLLVSLKIEVYFWKR